jgi:uncharacterized coiled-coil protein SlyX
LIENEQFKKQLVNFSNSNKRIPDLENKVAMLSQEIERLNTVVERKNGEIKALGG